MIKIQTQQEKITNLLKLISENPELEILPMVDSECVQGDEYSNWLAAWGNARVDYYYSSDERIYFKEYDFDELVENHIDNICDEKEYAYADNEDLQTIGFNAVEAYDWVKAIIVNIDPN